MKFTVTSFFYTVDGQTGVGDLSSSVYLHFTVPQLSTGANGNQETSRPIEKAELWLFPSFNTPSSDASVRWYELTLGFVFDLDGFNKDVDAYVDVLWRDSDECLMVDLTSATRKIARKLKNRDLNETLVTAKVTLHDKVKLSNRSPSLEEWQHTCSYLSPRTSNTSFLVVKYITDEDDSSSNRRKRAAATEPPSAGCCSLIEHTVRLQEVFGDWVVSPTGLVDVGACAGICDVTINRFYFSPRALLKDRLRTLTNTDSLESGLDFEVSCAPLTFDPLILLIHVAATDSYILMDYPVKAKSCGCR